MNDTNVYKINYLKNGKWLRHMHVANKPRAEQIARELLADKAVSPDAVQILPVTTDHIASKILKYANDCKKLLGE